MHNLYFTIFDKAHAKSSFKAREFASCELRNQGFVADENTMYGCGPCDWFVVGGRWSGELQMLTLGNRGQFYEKVEAVVPTSSEIGWTRKQLTENHLLIEKVWKKMGGAGENPLGRDSYAEFGFEDDAMLLTAGLIEKIKSQYKGEVLGDLDQCQEREPEELDEGDIGRWCVVIDYHN